MCSISCHVSCFALVHLKEKDEFNRFFQMDRGKTASAARNWSKFAPHTDATTLPCLLYNSILLQPPLNQVHPLHQPGKLYKCETYQNQHWWSKHQYFQINVNASHENFCLCVINMLTRTMKCCPALPFRNILVSVSFKVLLFTWDILHYNSLNIYIFCAELDLQTPELATVVIYSKNCWQKVQEVIAHHSLRFSAENNLYFKYFYYSSCKIL